MTVSNQIIEVINDLCNKFGVAIDWGQKNIVPYIQSLMSRYINYEIATSSIWLIVTGIVIIVCILIWKKIPKITDYSYISPGDEIKIIEKICLVSAILVCLFVFFVQLYDITRCLTIPELQVFDYLQSLQ